jgi:hypothetical protein
MKILTFCVLSLISVCYANEAEYQYMDQLALSAGTDKSSSYHHYTQIYSQYFADLKQKPITFLEIGIFRGASVKFWEQYFPNADLHFIDCTSEYLQYQSQRSKYHFMDQTNRKALQDLGKSVGGFDIILDDGGHTMQQQIISFQSLFPYVKSGGMYIIEDLHTSYWSSYGGHGSIENPKSGQDTAIDFCKNLVDDLNFRGARSGCADPNKFPEHLQSSLTEYQAHIYSIHFYDSVCIIKKK